MSSYLKIYDQIGRENLSNYLPNEVLLDLINEGLINQSKDLEDELYL